MAVRDRVRVDETAVFWRVCRDCGRRFASNDLSAAMCAECSYYAYAAGTGLCSPLPEATDEDRAEYYGAKEAAASEAVWLVAVYGGWFAIGSFIGWAVGRLGGAW